MLKIVCVVPSIISFSLMEKGPAFLHLYIYYQSFFFITNPKILLWWRFTLGTVPASPGPLVLGKGPQCSNSGKLF